MADDRFTDAHDRLFRSHFERVNRLADRAYTDARPAYQLGYSAAMNNNARGRRFEEVETDLENGWLNVRVGAGDWASVREFARATGSATTTRFPRRWTRRIPPAPKSGSAAGRSAPRAMAVAGLRCGPHCPARSVPPPS